MKEFEKEIQKLRDFIDEEYGDLPTDIAGAKLKIS